ncbi:MAG: hypothetical protein AAF734_09660, partial [Bacteroidota bacterium]
PGTGQEIPTQPLPPGTPEIPDLPVGCVYDIETEFTGHTIYGYHDGMRRFERMTFPIRGVYRALLPPSCNGGLCWENWDYFVIDATNRVVWLTSNIRREEEFTFKINDIVRAGGCCNPNECSGEEGVRFRFGEGSYACLNTRAPITAASYITLADGTTYELSLWGNQGTNEGVFCGEDIPEVEVAGQGSGDGATYRPLSPFPMPTECDNPDPCDCPEPEGDCGNGGGDDGEGTCPSGITLTPKVEVWNSDNPFNFREQMTLKMTSGAVIDGERAFWMVEERIHDKDGKGERRFKNIKNEDEAKYYFGADVNSDQWTYKDYCCFLLWWSPLPSRGYD